MSQQQEQKPKTKSNATAGILEKNGEPVELTEDQKIINELRKLNAGQMQQLAAQKKRPITVKRKTLSDYMRRSTDTVALLQVASNSYDEELNRYNVSFTQGSMA